MKRIGILTFHKSYNYGAFLQCYSLVKRLEADFPDAKIEVIDYTPEKIVKYYNLGIVGFFPARHGADVKPGAFSAYCRTIASKLGILIRNPFYLKTMKKRNKCIENAWKYLPLSEYSLVSDDFHALFGKIRGKYDIVVVGSDAVWNWLIRGFPNAYFLNSELQAKKLSYAASSYGQDYTSATREQCEYIGNALRGFTYIGVRDHATEMFVKSIGKELNPVHNCDPTVFLDMESMPVDTDMIKWKIERAGISLFKPIIGIMAGNWLGREIRRFFDGKYQIVAVYEPNRYADAFLFDLSPFEMARVFSFFKVTFTHYFHGTLLSLRNATPVIAVERRSAYSDKFDTKIVDVLKRLDLLEYHFIKEELDCKGWGIVEYKAHEAMSRPPGAKIRAQLAEEAKSYNNFKDALNTVMMKGMSRK